MTKQVYEDLKELEAVYKKLTCSIQQAFNIAKPVIYARWKGDKDYPICGNCGCNIYEEYIACSDYAHIYKPMKYCPNCGARMTQKLKEVKE